MRVLETGNGTEVVEQNATPVDSNKTDTYQISLTSSPGVGETVTITPNFNNTNLQLLDSNQNPITEITFDATNWNQSQVITVVGLDDSQVGTFEQIITHSSSSSDATSPYNSGPLLRTLIILTYNCLILIKIRLPKLPLMRQIGTNHKLLLLSV
ncbi:hypothetical protein WN50_33435 [Limnoraphis robusta CS-951]|uniref:Uncharacterized protein n=1 Tax=Limnoraphis robusta CS-951 TaxID=1637645 RepID=A0A0J9HND2_9CYAN|nr:hypothetical protein WN50_33435 [Limnoraphis robusta CS-951]